MHSHKELSPYYHDMIITSYCYLFIIAIKSYHLFLEPWCCPVAVLPFYSFWHYACEAVNSTRSNSSARNAIPSRSFSFERRCLITSARESLRETPRSSKRCYFALARVKAAYVFMFVLFVVFVVFVYVYTIHIRLLRLFNRLRMYLSREPHGGDGRRRQEGEERLQVAPAITVIVSVSTSMLLPGSAVIIWLDKYGYWFN